MEYKANRPLTSDNARLHFDVFLSAAPPPPEKAYLQAMLFKKSIWANV